MNIAFIRHGKTQGNIEKRYVGSINSPVCEQGLTELYRLIEQSIYPSVEHVYVSPMLRCQQTSALIYPNTPYTVVQGLHEQHFGDFENKTYAELEQREDFRKWLSTSGEGTPTGGETRDELAARCAEALAFVVSDATEKEYNTVAVLCHGGVMMRMFTAFATPKHSFYDWLCGNGRGYIFELSVQAGGQINLALQKSIDCEEAT